MATTKSTTANTKTTKKPSTKTAAKRTPAKSTTAQKATTAAKKATTIPKSASAKAKATRAIPADREQKLAEQALGLVDQAAAVLRERIRDGATQTAKTRLAAKRRASSLLERATRDLGKALDVGATNLQSLIRKI